MDSDNNNNISFIYKNETLHVAPSKRILKSTYLEAIKILPSGSYIKVDPFAFRMILVCAKTEKDELIFVEYDEDADYRDQIERNNWKEIQRIASLYRKIPVRFGLFEKK